MKLIGNDVSQGIRADKGRKGMQYRHICVLMAVRWGCNYTYDQLADLAENHRKLRAIMGLGDCDPTTFHHKTLRNTFCLVRPETIEQINLAIVQYGHQLDPQAIEKVRTDSFVMETNIYYPTESSLLYDGLQRRTNCLPTSRQSARHLQQRPGIGVLKAAAPSFQHSNPLT